MEVVESFGSYHLVKDSAGDHYAKEVSSGNLTKLYDSNGTTTVNQANFGGQTFYGVERINGKNYIAFYTSGDSVHLWDSGNGWTKEGAENISLEKARTWFKTDDIGGIGTPTYTITHYKSQMMKERREFMVAWCDALVEQGLIT